MVKVSCLVALLLFSVIATPQAAEVIKAVGPVVEKQALDVQFRPFGPARIVYLEMTGPYAQAGKASAALQKEVQKQKLNVTGPLLGIYYNSPATTPEDKLRWDVALFVKGDQDVEVAAPLQIRMIDECTVAQTTYRGAPDKIGPIYAGLVKAAADAGHPPVGPAIEAYTATPSSRIIDCTVMFVVGAGAEPEGPRPGAEGGEEPHGIPAELVIPEPVTLVFAEYSGGPGDIGPSTDAFLAELGKQGVEPVGPIMHVLPDGIGTEPAREMHWQVAVPIEGERELAEPLKLRWLPERIVARTAYPGPFEEAGPVIHGLIEYAAMRGYVVVGPPIVMHPPHPEGPEPEAMIEDAVEGIHRPEGPPMETILTICVVKMPPVESEIVIIGPQPQVVMAHEGPFEELNQATEAFMAALEAQGVERAGPCTRVFHTEPDKGPYAELFVPIHGEREVAEPLKLRIFPEAAYARAHYEGPKAGVRMAHEIMVHQMAERGWRPAGPLMQTIFEAGENHVACMLRFVVAKMEGEPEGEPEHPEMTDEGHIPVKILGPVKVIQPGEVKIEDPDAGQ